MKRSFTANRISWQYTQSRCETVSHRNELTSFNNSDKKKTTTNNNTQKQNNSNKRKPQPSVTLKRKPTKEAISHTTEHRQTTCSRLVLASPFSEIKPRAGVGEGGGRGEREQGWRIARWSEAATRAVNHRECGAWNQSDVLLRNTAIQCSEEISLIFVLLYEGCVVLKQCLVTRWMMDVCYTLPRLYTLTSYKVPRLKTVPGCIVPRLQTVPGCSASSSNSVLLCSVSSSNSGLLYSALF